MLHRLRKTQEEREGGFTLIELLIVIVVLGILAGIVVFGVGTFRADSQAAACKADVKTVNVAADAYNARNGSYPTGITDLVPGTPATGGSYLKTAPTGTWTFASETATRSPGC